MHKLSDKLVSFLEPEAIEPQALLQASRISRMPFIYDHVALMPDVHLGMGATVGSVIATEGAIIPAAVGVDIGCGMIAVRTNLNSSKLPDDLTELHHNIERGIPTGIGTHGRNSKLSHSVLRRLQPIEKFGVRTQWTREMHDVATKADASWTNQIGTLGGGNHFIELCIDETETVWIVLHSGSRGVGNKLANQHMKVAKQLMKNENIALEDPDLAYFLQGSPEFDEYMRALLWAQQFALYNREEMMDRVLDQLTRAVPETREEERINSHHNFTQQEVIHGKDIWVTRKGAVSAYEGQPCIIPGSMATGTFIATGLGNEASFMSAPHGAGRRMSRGEAKRTFTLEDLQVKMEGITARLRPSLIDEHPGAYKDVNMVMDRSSELVEVKHTLRQVMNIKGD